jgi:hypothetical protein
MSEAKCYKCGSKYIVNKKYMLCSDCNYLRIHGKTRFEVAREKEKSKPNKVYTLKRTPLKSKKTRIKSRPETVEKRRELLKKDREWYYSFFISRPHECEECGHWLPDEFEDENGRINFIGQYSHIVPKGARNDLRHNKLNCNRLCNLHHDQWEFGDRESMEIYKNNQKIIKEMQ